jgi:hypothetical protein
MKGFSNRSFISISDEVTTNVDDLTEANNPSRNFYLRHAPHLEGLSKLAVGITFAFYAIGLIITIAYEQSQGISDTGLLKARYVLVGGPGL